MAPKPQKSTSSVTSFKGGSNNSKDKGDKEKSAAGGAGGGAGGGARKGSTAKDAKNDNSNIPETSEQSAYLQIDHGGLMAQTGLTLDQLRELIEIFQLVDVDHGGTISADELETLMRQLGLRASQEELAAMVRELDQDGTGEIGFEAFVVGMSRKVQTTLKEEDLEKAFRVFAIYDEDNRLISDTHAAASDIVSKTGFSSSNQGSGQSNPNDSNMNNGNNSNNSGSSGSGGSGSSSNDSNQNGDSSSGVPEGFLPSRLVVEMLSEWGDPDKRLTKSEAEDMIMSVGPQGTNAYGGLFDCRQFVKMYLSEQ